MAILDEIASERVRLADVLDTLDDAQWATPSLCGAWTVRVAAAHLLMPLVTPLRGFLVSTLRARGDFNLANDRQSRAIAARMSTGEIVAGLRAQAGNRFHPPTFGHEAPITELVVHGQDIRRPLGLPVSFGPDALRPALDMLVSPKALRGFVPRRVRSVLTGLRIEADDVEWAHGDGPLLRGPGASLAYALTGRTASLGELTGPGVDLLRGR